MYFIQRLLYNAAAAGNDKGKAVLTWLEYEKPGSGKKKDSISFLKEKGAFSVRELTALVERVAGYYTKTLGLHAGDAVILCFPPGYEFYICFMACLYIGAVAVPVYPPQPANFSLGMEKLKLVAEKCKPVCILTTSDFKQFMFLMEAKQMFGGKRVKIKTVWKAIPSSLLSTRAETAGGYGSGTLVTPFVPKGHETAFLQFTSGSTGDPKGVIVTYEILNANLEMMKKDVQLQKGDVIVSWMPQYHDFGLIATALFPCAYEYHAVLMSPVTFLRHPLSWLLAITRYKAKGTASPNFGYTRCCKAWNGLDESDRPMIDLSSVNYFVNAAEPIRVGTLAKWEETFGPYGLQPSSMVPCYGMAESVVYIGGCWSFTGTTRVIIDEGTGMVACMNLEHDKEVDVKIVNTSTLAHANEGSVGEIWLSSASVAAGYYGQVELTREVFKMKKDGKDWLRTGDLGYIKSGYLYIAGRLKDLIIVNGRNIYPQDLELLLEENCQNLRPGCLAVFQMNTGLAIDGLGEAQAFGENSVGLVAEIRRKDDDMIATVRKIVTTLSTEGLSLEMLRFVETRTVPKTSSGKIRRSTCREYAFAGKLSVVRGGSFNKQDLVEIESSIVIAEPHQATKKKQSILPDCPEDEVSDTIKRVWKSVLELEEEPSNQDNFFALGGSSLQVFEMIGMLQTEFNLPLLNPSTVHSNPSVGGLSEAIALLSHQSDISAPSVIQWPTNTRPASQNQKQMWVLSRSGIDMSAYNIHLVLELQGPLDISSLSYALHSVVLAQESLRTSIHESDDGEIYSYVADEVDVIIEPYMFQQRNEIEQELQVLGSAKLDLEIAPLMRASILQTCSGASTLSLVFHHAIADFWSVRLIIDSLADGYEQQMMGENPDLPKPRISFSEYSQWQEKYLASEYASTQRLWWQKKLQGCPEVLTLPFDRPRPSEPTYSAGRMTSTLDETSLANIDAISKSSDCSVQSILLSGLAYILSVFSGQEDITIGVPTAGRELGETQSIVGYFVNSVPVRLGINKEETWEEFVKETAAGMISVMKNAAIPFQDIAQASMPGAHASNINPLFQVMFQYLPDVSNLSGTMGPVEYICRQAPPPKSAKFDITINLYSSGLLDVVYMEDLFDHSTIERIINAFKIAIDLMPLHYKRPMQSLPLVTGEEMSDMISSLSMGPINMDHLNKSLIHDSIEQQAKIDRNRVAIIDENGQELSYAELCSRAAYIAKLILCHSLESNEAILVLLERSFDLLAALLATWKAGCCFVPLDPDFPDARLKMYAEDSKSTVIISKSIFSQRLPTITDAHAIFLDTESALQENSEVQVRSPQPNDLAYIEFTSGSSGRPKGVPITQRSLSIYCHNVIQTLQLSRDAVSLFLTSINFDAYVRQTWAPLVIGGKVVVARNDFHTDPDYIMELSGKYSVTYMHAVPSLMLEYLRSSHAFEGLRSMQVLGTGGEAMNPRMLTIIKTFEDKWHQEGVQKSLLVYNSYGPTETTVSCTCHVGIKAGDRVTIGRPDFNMAAMVLDPKSRLLLPAGAPGELVISGPRISPGYLGNVEATEKVFTTNPFENEMQSNVPKGQKIFDRIYHTGDLVRWTNDAKIEFLGRVDRQIKIDGVRIELGEIESVILKHQQVEKVVVTGVRHPILKKSKLVAYVTPADVDTSQIMQLCESSLARSMVPTAIVTLDSIPLNPSGKVDIKSLPEPDFGADREMEYVPPHTEEERVVQHIWMDVLGIEEPISITANFFEIGGSSLNAGMVAAKLRKAFNKENIGNDLIFKEKTIGNIARAIGDHSGPQDGEKILQKTKIGDQTKRALRLAPNMKRQQEFAARKNASELFFGLKSSAMATTNFDNPFWLFEMLFLIPGLLASVINVLIPGLTIILSAVCQALPTVKSVWWVLLIAPGLYLGILILAFFITVIIKWAIFPRGMKPGFYPAHGCYYARWLAYHAIYRRVSLFLFPHIGRTELWNIWLRMLGAKIGKRCRIDTVHIYEPDLVCIGENVVIEEEVHVSSSIVSPPGLISSKVPSLTLSTILVGDNSKLLRKCVVQAGARIPQNTILRPYGTNYSVGSVLRSNDPKYDKFDVELHMSSPTYILARLTITLLNIISYYPGCMLAYSVAAWSYSIKPTDFLYWLYYLSVNGPPPGADVTVRFIMLPIVLIVFGLFILAFCTIFSQYGTILIWKTIMMGKFSKGRHLKSQKEFFSYLVLKELWRMPFWIIFERNMHSLFFTNPMYRLLGCDVGVDCIICGIVEPEAISLGHKSDAGGISGFQTVGKDGVVCPIKIGDGASYGHSTFYPGCTVGAFSIVGNETDVPANSTVEQGYNLQGDLLFPGGVLQNYSTSSMDTDAEKMDPSEDESLQNVLKTPKFDIFAPDALNVTPKLIVTSILRSIRTVFLFLLFECLNLLVAFGPLSIVFTTLYRELHWTYKWSIAESIFGAATTVLPCMLLSAFLCAIWLRVQVVLLRGNKIWRKEKVPVNNLSSRLLMSAIFRCLIILDSLRGTRIYTYLLRLSGWKIGKKSIIFGVPNVEIPLMEAGDVILESDAKIATHYIQSGEFYNKPLKVGSGSWFQTRCRVLGAKSIGTASRILPGSMVMPNEEIQDSLIWGGVPATPLSSAVGADDECHVQKQLSRILTKSLSNWESIQPWQTVDYSELNGYSG